MFATNAKVEEAFKELMASPRDLQGVMFLLQFVLPAAAMNHKCSQPGHVHGLQCKFYPGKFMIGSAGECRACRKGAMATKVVRTLNFKTYETVVCEDCANVALFVTNLETEIMMAPCHMCLPEPLKEGAPVPKYLWLCDTHHQIVSAATANTINL